ncbi:MAG TPA: ATP-binding protein [Humisphaera sp.]|jgi:two-component system sensor histidine kinase QseC|nr:ATP-binding protein [Humisphaera sp.]
MIRSLRARLLIGTTVITTAALLLLGWAIDHSVRRTLLAEFDNALLAKAKSLSSMVEYHNGTTEFEFDPAWMPEFTTPTNPDYFEIWVDGQPFARSQSLGKSELGSAPQWDLAAIWSRLPDGRTGRTVGLAFPPFVDPDERVAGASPVPAIRASLVVARDTRGLDATLSHLRWIALLTCAAVVGISGAALLLLVSVATRPVRVLAHRIESLTESDLNLQLASTSVPLELAPVVDRLNGLLTRLADAFTRERSFTADVAHELRTPLAGIRATLEVCRTRPRDVAGYEATIDKSLDQLLRLQSLVENLLLLARADAGQVRLNLAAFELRAFIEDCWAPFETTADKQELQIDFQLPDECAVVADRQFLAIVMTNLFDNAVSYCTAGGRIELRVAATGTQSGTQIILELSNSADVLPTAQLAQVFARFWRGDTSRAATGRHAGLGLSLCKRLLELMGSEIAVQSLANGTFAVHLKLTRAATARPTSESPRNLQSTGVTSTTPV